MHFLVHIMNNIHFISIPEGELEAANLGRGYPQNYPRKQKTPRRSQGAKVFLINIVIPLTEGQLVGVHSLKIHPFSSSTQL